MASNIKAEKIKKRDLDDDILEWLNKLSSMSGETIALNTLNKKITDLQNEAVTNTSFSKTLKEYFNKNNDKITSSIVDPSFINDLSDRFMLKNRKVDYGDLSSQLSNDIKAINTLVSGDTLNSIQRRIASLENLTKDIKSISDNISTINLADLSRNINNLNTDIETCQSDLSDLDMRTAKCEQLGQTLTTANVELQNTIDLLKTQIDSMSNNTDNTNSQSSEKDSSKKNSILKMIHVIDANDDDSDDKMDQLKKKEVPYILVLHSDNGYGANKTVFWTGAPMDSEIHGFVILTGTKYTGDSPAIFLLKITSSSTNDNPSGTKFCWCKVGSEEEYIGKIDTLAYSDEISAEANTDYTLSDGITIRFVGGGFQAGDVFTIKVSPNENYPSKLAGAKKFSYMSNVKDDGIYTDWKLISSINNIFLNIIDYGLYYNDNGVLTEIFSNAIKKTNINIKQGATVEKEATELQFHQAKLYCLNDSNRKISAEHYVSMAYDNKIYLTNNADKDIDVILEVPESGGDLF